MIEQPQQQAEVAEPADEASTATRRTRGWSAGSTRARVFFALRVSPRPMSVDDLLAMLLLDDDAVKRDRIWAELSALRSMGLLLPGPRGALLQASKVDQVPYPAEYVRGRALSLLEDCASGMTRRAIARELGVGQAEVQWVLQPLVLRYELQQIRVDRPEHLDGGTGYRITPGQVKAQEFTIEYQPDARAAATPVRKVCAAADVPAEGQHRHAMVGQHGAYAITCENRLQIAWGGDAPMRMTLPTDTTRELLQWLTDALEHLAADAGGSA